jgi:sec-independent protein translocase protein TatB
MFDISWTEFLLIGVVALVVIGPKELPGVLRTLGQWTRKVRGMATEFQNQFQEAMREAEMADLKKQVDDMAHDFKHYDPLKDVRDPLKDVREDVEAAGRDIQSSLDRPPEAKAAAAAAGEPALNETAPEAPAVTADAAPALESPASAEPHNAEPVAEAAGDTPEPEPEKAQPEHTERAG